MSVTQAMEILKAELLLPEGTIFLLRQGKGLNEDGYKRIVLALNAIHDDWRTKDLIPKQIVALIYPIASALEACSFGYPNAQASMIREKAMEIADSGAKRTPFRCKPNSDFGRKRTAFRAIRTAFRSKPNTCCG